MQNDIYVKLEHSIRLLSAEIIQHLNTEDADIDVIMAIMNRRDEFIYSAFKEASDALREQLLELLTPLFIVENAALLPYRKKLIETRNSISAINQLAHYVN